MEQAKTLSMEQQAVSLSLLWKNSRFLCLAGAAILSSFAFSIYLMSETWYVIKGLNLDAKLGLILMATTIPRVLLMAIGGVAADRIRRSVIMSISSISRGLLVLVLAYLVFQGAASISILFVFACIFGILDSFFWPASNSILPTLVTKEQLVRANSVLQTTNQLSFLLGPVIAGALIKFGSFKASFATAGIMIMLSGLFVLFMKEPKKNSSFKKTAGFFKDLKEGILYVKRVPYLLTSMITSVIANLFLVGPMNAGLPLLVEGRFHGDVMDLSVIESSLAIGMLAGALFTGIVNFKRKRSILSLSLIGTMAILNGSVSQLNSTTPALGILFTAGVCLAISNIIGPSITQQIVEPEMMGRVQSLMSTASNGFTPISYALVAALLTAGLSISVIMLVSSMLLLLWIVIILLTVKVVRTID
ncbi:MFS transporter [Peribacillus kribbensis]|uniref:MFS transporter n=1 Tax=Peribacillus kribbensis TaxID=356658 RepID=UPI00041AECBC|nr:MFS transporter [Peribacillus kribbensis]